MAFTLDLGGDRTVEVAAPTRDSYDANLHGTVQYLATSVLYRALDWSKDFLGDLLGKFVLNLLEALEPELAEYTRPIIDQILETETLPDPLRGLLEGLREPTQPIEAAALIPLLMGMLVGVVSGLGNLAGVHVAYQLNHVLHSARTSPADTWQMFWRGEIGEETKSDYLQDMGWHPDIIEAYGEVLQPRLGVRDLVRYSYREHRAIGPVKKELGKRGWSDESLQQLATVSEQMPSISDLVNMALREAWRDDIALTYGYDEDRPDEFLEAIERQGMPEEWGKRYWRAHWRLPSPQMAFSLLHRGELDPDQVRELLKVADYPAGWRDLLMKLSYHPYTRVDVRRMFALGIIGRAKVKETYKWGGYDEEHAENLTRWTEAYYVEQERGATKADLVGAYRDDVLTRPETQGYLLGMGYPDWLVELYLDREDYKKTKALTDLKVDAIRTRYRQGTIDKLQARSELATLGKTATHVDLLLEKWGLQNTTSQKLPTSAELSNMLFRHIIDAGQFTSTMQTKGYRDDHIDWYARTVTERQAEAARTEAERASKEEERTRKSDVSTARQIRRAELSTVIAEHKVTLAEINLALWDVTTYEAYQELKHLIDVTKVAIAKAQVTKARVPLDVS